jgi:hypothetical protein
MQLFVLALFLSPSALTDVTLLSEKLISVQLVN